MRLLPSILSGVIAVNAKSSESKLGTKILPGEVNNDDGLSSNNDVGFALRSGKSKYQILTK